MYISSRALYGLASRGHAPKFLTKTRKDGLPWVCVLVSMAFSLLSFMAADQSGEAGTVFGYCKLSPAFSLGKSCVVTTFGHLVSNMTAICGMISWACILWTSIRWNKGLKVQGIDRATLAYTAPLQPYLSYCKYSLPTEKGALLIVHDLRRNYSCNNGHHIWWFYYIQ